MKKAEITELLTKIGDENASKQLAALISEFKQTEHYELLDAVTEHMLRQRLRQGSGGEEGYGIVQGINAVTDFLTFLEEYSAPSAEEPKINIDSTLPPTQGNYGLT